MNPEIVSLLTRFVVAHENMAASVTRIADSLHYSEYTITDHTELTPRKTSLADELMSKLGDLTASVSEVAEEIKYHGKEED